jgi:YD repeat-containing protein
MGATTKYTERKFLGVLPENPTKEQKRFHQKHEHAYLQGHERFRFGFETYVSEDGDTRYSRDENGQLISIWHLVQQQVTTDTEKKLLLTGKP